MRQVIGQLGICSVLHSANADALVSDAMEYARKRFGVHMIRKLPRHPEMSAVCARWQGYLALIFIVYLVAALREVATNGSSYINCAPDDDQ